MDAGVFATVLFAIAQVRQTRSDSNWILGEVNGTYAGDHTHLRRKPMPQTQRRRTGAAHTKRC